MLYYVGLGLGWTICFTHVRGPKGNNGICIWGEGRVALQVFCPITFIHTALFLFRLGNL